MLIFKEETPENIQLQKDFIFQCASYTSDIITIPNSPWGYKSNPIRYWVQNGQDRLGPLQIKIIQFLHKNYFSRGKPVYLKARIIAKRLDADIKQIIKSISRLVERGIITKINFIYNSNTRTMLVPAITPFKKFILDNIDFLKNCVGGTTTPHLFRNLAKKLQISKLIYKGIILFQQLYIRFKSLNRNQKINVGCSAPTRQANCLPVEGIPSDKKAPLLKKHTLKILNPLPDPPKEKPFVSSPVSDEMKLKIKDSGYKIDHLSIQDQNLLISLVDKSMMINMSPFIRGLRLKQVSAKNRSEKFIKMIIWMWMHDLDLDIPFTQRAVGIWNSNSNGHTNITNHSRSNEKTAQFENHAIALSYHKHFNGENGESIVLRAMRRMFTNGHNHPKTMYMTKKITIEDVFVNPLNREIWNLLIYGDDQTWSNFVSNGGVKVIRDKKEVEKVKKLFLHFFYQYKPENGIKLLDRFEKSFAFWISRIINSQKKYNRHLGGLDLIFPKDSNSPSVMFEFFNWFSRVKMIHGLWMNQITSDEIWQEFYEHMRLEQHPNFWKRATDVQEE